jgi:hypothetical protein
MLLLFGLMLGSNNIANVQHTSLVMTNHQHKNWISKHPRGKKL